MILPKKKVATEYINNKKRFNSDSIKKDLKKLSNICQQCATELGQKLTTRIGSIAIYGLTR